MASQVSTKVVSPGAFPELLRRSRFASFDPTIRQSYGTPPSHLHRGNWGLKRPIAQRKRNAFISLKNFEEHEHYIEWNNAESQVRLINKIEELNITPRLAQGVPWFVGLGPAASSSWSKMDSEFAPGETGMPHLIESASLFTRQREGLGLPGEVEHDTNSSTKNSNEYLHPNLAAMSPKVFNRYLKKLRSLRPEFQKFLKENNISTSVRESGIPSNWHIRFLGQHFEKQFRDSRDETKTDVHPNQTQPIRQQPHRTGGLMYATPTYLESYFTSNAQPGIVLEKVSHKDRDSGTGNANAFLVSTAGIVGNLSEKRAGADIDPAFNTGGIAYPPAALLARGDKTFINVKVIDLQLERLPVAVTAFPSRNSSKEVSIRMELARHSSESDHWRTNTHTPGSMLYIAPDDSQQQLHSRNIFARNIANMYGNKKRELRKFHGEGDLTNNPHKGGDKTGPNTTDIMFKLGKLQTGSKQRPLGKAGTALKDMNWNRPRASSWKDEWIEAPSPSPNEDDENTGQGDGNTGQGDGNKGQGDGT